MRNRLISGKHYHRNLSLARAADTLFTTLMERHVETYGNDRNTEVQRLIPSLLRSAADPRIDALGRSSIFDALRQLTGHDLTDDIASWTAWYASAYGTALPAQRTNIEDLISACPWLPQEAL